MSNPALDIATYIGAAKPCGLGVKGLLTCTPKLNRPAAALAGFQNKEPLSIQFCLQSLDAVSGSGVSLSEQLNIQGSPFLFIRSLIITIFIVSIVEQLLPIPVMCLV